MEKIWLKNYPAGVPEEADLDEWPSLKHVFDEACKKYRDLPAFTNMGKTITYSELDQQSRYFGAFLQNNAGLEKGDRVALMMPNLLQYPVALFGVLRTGMVAVNVNPLYTPRELQHQLSDSGAKAIVILENFASTLEKVIDKTDVKTVIVTGIGDMLGFPKRSIVNFAIRHVKRMVPDWNVPHAIPFLRALNDGKWQTLEDVEVGQEDLA
ncbi:MAG: long-chain-fatty-acid--CoA ligase, partial [Chromatiales bacterium]